jgi:hypothetical protein
MYRERDSTFSGLYESAGDDLTKQGLVERLEKSVFDLAKLEAESSASQRDDETRAARQTAIVNVSLAIETVRSCDAFKDDTVLLDFMDERVAKR